MNRFALALACICCVHSTFAMGADSPVIPGLGRAGLSQRLRGLVLIGELGCVACHDAGPLREVIRTKRAPVLAGIGERVNPEFLRTFIASPRDVKPGTTMPDVLGREEEADAEARRRSADALTHYLVSLSSGAFTPRAPDRVAAVRGRDLFHSIGCVACHSPRDENDAALLPIDSVPLGRLERKYSVTSLTAFLEFPHDVRPGGRMPTFKLTPNEAYEIANYLTKRARVSGALRDATEPKPHSPFVVDAVKAAEGKTLFSERGCVNCHTLDDDDVPSRQSRGLSELDPKRGCLSARAGSSPFYSLGVRQIEAIRSALASPDDRPTPEERVRMILATFNCIACHRRGDRGGVSESRGAYYTSADANLGEAGRLPPPLTGVGAKIRRDWLRKTIAHGQSLRSYMSLRMPGYGKENADELTNLLARLDSVPPANFEPLPADRKKANAIRDIGRKLVGDKGMNCVSCHTFRGQSSGSMRALDLVETTGQRLRPDWFYKYMLDPPAYRSITIMPQFFPEGTSVLLEIESGDPRRQLGAIWHYLSEGRNTRAPSGLRRPSMEIVVEDEAVMLRRSAQDTGKRAISVGYPLGVSLTFDAESVCLNQIWRGRFIDAGGVWSGQGSGAASIRSRDRVRLFPSLRDRIVPPSLAALADESAPWPTKSSRELGLRFKGYELDERRRPTFRYTFDGLEITDKPVDRKDVNGPGAVFLERRLTLRGSKDRTLFFRVAVSEKVEDRGDGSVALDGRAIARARGAELRVRPSTGDGVPREVIVPVEIRDGEATLLLEYRWLTKTR